MPPWRDLIDSEINVRIASLHYGDMRTDAAFMIARNVRMNSSPSEGENATVRSPARSTVGTYAAWSARV